MFQHILVPLDGSPLAECVLPHAVAIAKAFNSKITLLQVMERDQFAGQTQSVDPLGWHIRKAEASVYLDELAGRFQKLGIETTSTLLEGKPVEQISDFFPHQDIDLIILSSHGRSGLSGWNISSMVQKILLYAYIPALIVRAYHPIVADVDNLHYDRVLVPLDGSQRAECVLPMVARLTRDQQSQLILSHLVTRPEMPRRTPLTDRETDLVNQIVSCNQEDADLYLNQLQSRLPEGAETRLLIADDVTAALHDLVEQEKISLVVLSAHGYSGRTRWPYGSVTLSFIAYGTTPLLIFQDLSRENAEKSKAELAATEYKGH